MIARRDREQLEVRQRRQVGAVDERRALGLQPDRRRPSPTGERRSSRSSRGRSSGAPARGATEAPSSSMPASTWRSTSATVMPLSADPDLAPERGREADHDLVGALAGARPGPSSRSAMQPSRARLLEREVRREPDLAHAGHLAATLRRHAVARAGPGVVVGVGERREHVQVLVEDRRGLEHVAEQPLADHLEHALGLDARSRGRPARAPTSSAVSPPSMIRSEAIPGRSDGGAGTSRLPWASTHGVDVVVGELGQVELLEHRAAAPRRRGGAAASSSASSRQRRPPSKPQSRWTTR